MKKLLRLDPHDLTTLPEDEKITLEKGRLWVTFEGDPNDYFVEAGEKLQPSGRNVLIEALEQSELIVELCKAV